MNSLRVVLLSSMLVAVGPRYAQATETRSSASAKAPQRADAAGGEQSSYEVSGRRYRVHATSDGYRERGIASWYGHPFDGRPTSSGEMYDMNKMTAAHPTLPIPTWVDVKNLANGKHIVVKVNDRGPFVGKRLIDLSFAAATALDMIKDGTARVEVRALPGPPPETTAGRRGKRDEAARSARERSNPAEGPRPLPAPPKPRPDSQARAGEGPPADAERLFVEAGKFTNRDDAVQLVDRLKAQGLMNAFVVTEDGRRKSSHRVRIGPLHDRAEVESMSERLRDLGAKHARSVAMR